MPQDTRRPRLLAILSVLALLLVDGLAARGETLAAFDGRRIPGGGVAPPSNTAGILSRRALPAGRVARIGATPEFHHGLLGQSSLWGLGRVIMREHPELWCRLIDLSASTVDTE